MNQAPDPNPPSASGRSPVKMPIPRTESATAPRAPRPGANGAVRTRARDPLTKLLDRQHGVLSREQAAAFGIATSTITYRVKPGGPWQRILPRVYLTGRSTPTVDQLDMAALLYAGNRSLLTGRAALRRVGIWPAATGIVDVLVPATSRPATRDYVRVHRTARLPRMYLQEGSINFTMIPRAITDAALAAGSVRDTRAIVCIGVDRGCTLDELAAELGTSRLANSARLRAVLGDVARGIRSGPEGDLMDLIDKSGLPEPVYNPRLYVGGIFLASPDAWWEKFGVAAEVDSREYHYDEADWEHTMQRHARMTAAGIAVLHFTPRRIRTQPAQVIAIIRDTLRHGGPIAGVRTVPFVQPGS